MRGSHFLLAGALATLLLVLASSVSPRAATPPLQTPATRAAAATFVGSAACQKCHAQIYQRWSTTRMANVVTDPKVHPEAILPDFGKPDPLLTFTRDDIAFVYGSRWKQRYFKKVGDDYYPLPAQWDVANKVWRPYFVQPNTDWWVPHYPADNMQRPTGPLCDGCHSVNYNVKTKAVTEWNVGCERCHGPGSAHVAAPSAANIVNPSKLDYVRASDTCIQCHSQGKPLQNPIEGKYFDWPVGFNQGDQLKNYWELEEHKLGETTFTHFADGTAHKNRMQGNDFVQSVMYRRGVTCFNCHDSHSTNPSLLIRQGNDLCLGCHRPGATNGPRATTVEAHTHHAKGSAGDECIACHMPKIEQTIANVNVRSHTFAFITPKMTDDLKVPNPCTTCHTDKTTAWARQALATWPDVSPWRVQ
jgi:predicted CXXCH cytochrome family protein